MIQTYEVPVVLSLDQIVEIVIPPDAVTTEAKLITEVEGEGPTFDATTYTLKLVVCWTRTKE